MTTRPSSSPDAKPVTIMTSQDAATGNARYLVPLADGPEGEPRAADMATFPNGRDLSVSVSVSSGCVGRCERICPSGAPRSLQMPMFTADEIVHQFDEAMRLTPVPPGGFSEIDIGTFADGEPASNAEAVLEAASTILSRGKPYVHHIGVSTIGFKHGDFLPAFIETAKRFAPGRLRLHYSYYGPGETHTSFVPRPSPPVEEVIDEIANVGVETGFPVTMNVPMMVGETDTGNNMLGIVRQLSHLPSGSVRVKLSSYNSDGPNDPIQASSGARMHECAAILSAAGIPVKVFNVHEDADADVEVNCGRLGANTRRLVVARFEAAVQIVQLGNPDRRTTDAG